MSKTIAIVQSNYVPWKGYFDLISSVDEFVLLDDAQFTKRDWRNRNLIKTPGGLAWLTVPVRTKGRFYQAIKHTEIDNDVSWALAHWRSLEANYKRARHFDDVRNWLKPLYLSGIYTYLSDLNDCFLRTICSKLEINTVVTNSSSYPSSGKKSERLLDICLQAGADHYVSGPSAKSYLDCRLFEENGVRVSWFQYKNFPEYVQLWGAFVHEVSILDLFFNCGPESKNCFKQISGF